MAITERYFDPDLATGLNDGTSEANAWQTWSQMQTDHVAGERVNAKKTSSPYQPGADIAFAVSATDLLVSIFRGYGSTIGDGVKFQFDMETASSFNITGQGCLIQSVDVTGSDISNLINISGDVSRIEDFISINTGTSTNAHQALALSDNSASNGYVENNTTGSTGAAISIVRGNLANMISVSTAIGIRASFSFRSNSISNCLVYEKGSSGAIGVEYTNLDSSQGGMTTKLTVDGFTDAIKFVVIDDIASSSAAVIIIDSIVSNATVGIFNTDTATKNICAVLSGIAFYNCGTDTQLGDNEVLNKISLSADPYTDAANDDYSLNNTASGGADVRAISNFGGGQVTNYADIGALQSVCTAIAGVVIALALLGVG